MRRLSCLQRRLWWRLMEDRLLNCWKNCNSNNSGNSSSSKLQCHNRLSQSSINNISSHLNSMAHSQAGRIRLLARRLSIMEPSCRLSQFFLDSHLHRIHMKLHRHSLRKVIRASIHNKYRGNTPSKLNHLTHHLQLRVHLKNLIFKE
jgi:hypothetical protein